MRIVATIFCFPLLLWENRIGRGQHTNGRTLRLLDQIGPVGRFSENISGLISVGEYLQSSLIHDGGEGVWQGWLGASVGARVLKKDASESGTTYYIVP